MRKLWIFNIGCVPGLDLVGALQTFTRYLLYVNPGDKCVVPNSVNRCYLEYLTQLKKLGRVDDWIIPIHYSSDEFQLDTALIQDQELLNEIKHSCKAHPFFIESYYLTPAILSLSKQLEIPICSRDPIPSQSRLGQSIEDGLVDQLNDKFLFKSLATTIDVPVISGRCCSSIKEIHTSMHQLYSETKNRMIVKKYKGSGDSLCGDYDQLSAVLDTWYDENDTVIVEQYKEASLVLGTMHHIATNRIISFGLDLQIIENNSWVGCRYPYIRPEIENYLNMESQKFASMIHKRGLVGNLNIDWLIIEKGLNDFQAFALECNFRLNGFDCLVSVGKSILGEEHQHYNMMYYQNFLLSDSCREADMFLQRVKELNSELKHLSCHVIAAGVPAVQKGPLIILSPSGNLLSSVEEHIQKRLKLNYTSAAQVAEQTIARKVG